MLNVNVVEKRTIAMKLALAVLTKKLVKEFGAKNVISRKNAKHAASANRSSVRTMVISIQIRNAVD